MRNLALMWVLAGVAVALLAAGDGKPSVSTFTDKRDGKVYKIVKIGSQKWFAENLNYAAEGSVCYDNKNNNCARYGRLYNWETALTACPVGTHLPTDKEWDTLVDYAGGKEKAGKKLKSKTGWNENGNGTNDYGWSALPGGNGFSSGYFLDVGNAGYWWDTTEDNADEALGRGMDYDTENVFRYNGSKRDLFSVRCVQDKRKESQK